jgi:hypothetical protein
VFLVVVKISDFTENAVKGAQLGLNPIDSTAPVIMSYLMLNPTSSCTTPMYLGYLWQNSTIGLWASSFLRKVMRKNLLIILSGFGVVVRGEHSIVEQLHQPSIVGLEPKAFLHTWLLNGEVILFFFQVAP